MATYLEIPSLETGHIQPTQPERSRLLPEEGAGHTNWCAALPVLHGLRASLRELRLSDAPSLLAALSTEEVARFIAPPPATVAEFEQFIEWADDERKKGNYICLVVVPEGSDTAIGIFQLKKLDSAEKAEWGFALEPAYWGTGVFADCAELVVSFAFDTIGVTRLEATAMTANGRGNGALRKIGATMEGVLRKSIHCKGELVDECMWSILRDEWSQRRPVWTSVVH
jgi:RimJ/RimL family protein N-acetyltransferase